MAPPLIELGGSGPVLHWAPANGFPAEAYGPLLMMLSRRFRVVSVLPRALWRNGPPPPGPGSWLELAADLVEGLEANGVDTAVLAGHSFGAVASLLAARRGRLQVDALVLLDPTILLPDVLDRMGVAQQASWRLEPDPLVARTLERRSRFESPDAAFTYWRKRPLFADWSDEALHQYAVAALKPSPPGGDWTLRWTPEWEAYYYEAIYTRTWSEIAALDPGLPVLLARGERSDTFSAEAEHLFLEKVPWVETAVVRDHGHLFPLSAPGVTGALLDSFLHRARRRVASGAR